MTPDEYPLDGDTRDFAEWLSQVDRPEPDQKRLGIVSRDFAERLAYGQID
jgi:hypothetical protein